MSIRGDLCDSENTVSLHHDDTGAIIMSQQTLDKMKTAKGGLGKLARQY